MAISLALIILLGLLSDYIFRQIKLPGIIGMLFAGIIAGPYVLNLLFPVVLLQGITNSKIIGRHSSIEKQKKQ